jgi:hypothetical protein
MNFGPVPRASNFQTAIFLLRPILAQSLEKRANILANGVQRSAHQEPIIDTPSKGDKYNRLISEDLFENPSSDDQQDLPFKIFLFFSGNRTILHHRCCDSPVVLRPRFCNFSIVRQSRAMCRYLVGERS